MSRPNQKKPQNIIVYLRGGVVQDVYKPKRFADVPVEIHDYDVDDDSHPSITVDQQGEKFSKGVW